MSILSSSKQNTPKRDGESLSPVQKTDHTGKKASPIPQRQHPSDINNGQSQTGDQTNKTLAPQYPDTFKFSTSLDSLNEMEKIRAIGELSRINNSLNDFIRDELTSFDPQSHPPTQKELLEKWHKRTPPVCSTPDMQTWADREILQKLDQTRITLTRNHELTQIDDARKNWTSQLEQARNSADETSVQHWEQLGKGIFYPDQEESRQKEISRRFSDYKTIQDQINTQPALVLEYLQTTPDSKSLPPSIKSYWETQARKNLAGKQETFYKTLIENDLKGTPFREDLLEQAEQQQLISPDRKKAYLERFTRENPLRNEESMSRPFMNTLYDLIHAYSPERDIKGERKRSIYAMIAESDCEPDEKGNMIRQFARQRNSPILANRRNEASDYLRERYDRDGFGEFSTIPTSRDSQTSEEIRGILARSREKAWLASEKKWTSAQKAVSEYLEENEGSLPTRQEWQTLLPKLLYKATRTPRRIFTDDNDAYRGYPMFARNISDSQTAPVTHQNRKDKSETAPESSMPQQTPAPQTWQETLSRYFSEHPDATPKRIRQDMNTLYNQWLNRKNPVSLSGAIPPTSQSAPLI